ncbi:MAG: hypothetical protein M3384_10250 [Acidobacteriota bacterium]|nr:hypothetical protein [Acidobacteriota bacterium]
MEELIKQVTARTGISEEQAQQAVEVVVGFLKDKLPAPIAGQLDNVVSGGGEGGGGTGIGGGLSDIAGGFFGGKRE